MVDWCECAAGLKDGMIEELAIQFYIHIYDSYKPNPGEHPSICFNCDGLANYTALDSAAPFNCD